VTSIKRKLAGCSAVLLCGIASTVATAQGFYNDRTCFTFNRAVELPGGRTLQPGKYVFRLVDSSEGRHIVQVLSENETKTFATILAVEPSEAIIVVGEAPAKAPQPIRYWYHSGRTVGAIDYAFVYPKDQATRIAKATNQRVLMADANANDVEAMMRAQVRTVDPNGAVAEYRENVRPQARSTSAAATTREEKTPVQEAFNAARSERPEVAGVQMLTLIGLTFLLGAALVTLRVHSRAHPRPLERPLEQLGALKASRELRWSEYR
jgi:hypothetical protein